MFYDRNINELSKELEQILMTKERKVTIYTPNVDHMISIDNEASIKNLYKNADILTADGWPIVMVSKLKKKIIFKITGVDLMDKLLYIANERNLNIFFLGSTDETLERMVKNIRKDYQGINKICTQHGYFRVEENDNIISLINNSKPDILLVGMGHPKQEIWVDENKDKIDAQVILAIGGAFKIFSKEIKRAPKLIQKLGLEWFWRFIKEPTRLFKRYFIKYPRFIKIAIRELASHEE